MQKQEKQRDSRFKRFWRPPKAFSTETTSDDNSTRTFKSSKISQTNLNNTQYTSLSTGLPNLRSSSTSSSSAATIAASNGSALNAFTASLRATMLNKPTCSLPLLQVWPSQDSPRGEADGQSFTFPVVIDRRSSIQKEDSPDGEEEIGPNTQDIMTTSFNKRLKIQVKNEKIEEDTISNEESTSLFCADSGIESVQATPSPNALLSALDATSLSTNDIFKSASPLDAIRPMSTPSADRKERRRKSSTLLHPDHARLFAYRMKYADQTASIEDVSELQQKGNSTNLCSISSSTTSSLTSVAAISQGAIGGYSSSQAKKFGSASASSSSSAAIAMMSGVPLDRQRVGQQRVSDPWLRPQSDREQQDDANSSYYRRRSSSTTRYSLFDALDLEYALLRAAARGSVGHYSLSDSVYKLTFTQSLAFPALARGLAHKRRRSHKRTSTRPLHARESGLNTCAKLFTAFILVFLSFLVFLIVYKFVGT